MLKPCLYRKFNQGQLECEIAEIRETGYTSSTSVDVCNECPIPEIIQQVNCKNFIPLKLHLFINSHTFEGDPKQEICSHYWDSKCQKIYFQNKHDYEKKCSDNCPAFQAIYVDLSTEKYISIPKLNTVTATDHELRQAVLLILYEYYREHPDRYKCFDVTPEFIAKSLNINVKDVVRVVLPMEDEKEVETKKYLGETYFRYVHITSQGIRMIDEKPLFGSLDTAALRSIKIENSQFTINGDMMPDYYNNDNDLRGANIANFANQVQNNASQTASDFSQNICQNINEINNLISSLREIAQTFPEAQREEAIVHLDDLQEDIKLTIPEKQKPRIKARIGALLALTGIVGAAVAGTVDFSNNVLELSNKLGFPIEHTQP
ncbi:hypothetical protein [Cylindrospermum sp. FACHB-282]|uniref:hypothetical protein n=1 Tax=Cylindrospermum sp. FACHB-282 TaxID=2692794 RepID=UPI001689D0D6|nr:hypothetical protein [Cylindrospermum sp. FACHB-282]MBD2387426.1 hypothetical protein [Cylindrospermum sp. FACHB-282]